MKLTIELVPKTCFFSNVRSEISATLWDILRKETYRKANYRCEICNGKGEKWPVECHEIWQYDDKKKTQTLAGLIGLCPSCHEVKHMGLAQIKGNGQKALKHFAVINDLTLDQANIEIKAAFNQWLERSEHNWKLDISWLLNRLDQQA